MSNAINILLEEKIKEFKFSFVHHSKSLFVKEDGGLFQAYEFGAYRENVVKKYLINILPERMGIESGFVVTSNGRVSTQCDIIIYDKTVTPLIRNEYGQRFFPVESVVAVGEVKSKLSLVDFKEALLKLSTTKALRDILYEPSYVYSRKDGRCNEFKPESDELDQMITFLVCENFLFDIRKIDLSEIVRCYGESKPHRPFCHRHNMVLSIQNGLLAYGLPDNMMYPFPSKLSYLLDGESAVEGGSKVDLLNYRWISPLKNKESIEHIRHFTSMLHTALVSVSVLFPDMANYIQSEEDIEIFDLEQNYKF